MNKPAGNTPIDPMAFLKSIWESASVPLPGLTMPTLDTDELEKRIMDLKAVEGWLKTNLGVLQMTIQGLEVQRATLTALQAVSQSVESTKSGEKPGEHLSANTALSALWPWNLMQPMTVTSDVSTNEAHAPQPAEKPAKKTSKKTQRNA